MAKGQKTCPDCAVTTGCRSKECKNCGYVFTKKIVTPIAQDDSQDEIETQDETNNGTFQNEAPKKKARKSVWRGEKITVETLKAGCLSLYVTDEENMVSIEGPYIRTNRFEPNLDFNSVYAMVQADLKNKSISVWNGTIFEGSPSMIISEALV